MQGEPPSVLGLNRKRAGSGLPTQWLGTVCDGGEGEDQEARLKTGSGSLAAVGADGTNGMQNLGAGSLGLFCPFCPFTLPPPPSFSRWGGAEVRVQIDSGIPPPPPFFFNLSGWTANVL